MKTIVLGGGRFWDIEAVFQRVAGIGEVVSGFAGGTLTQPTDADYGDHAEVVQLTYDSEIISLGKIMDIFLFVHNPTSVNRQGDDIGAQYRSVVLVNDYLESDVIHRAIDGNRALWDSPIITEITLLDVFYPVASEQQNYFNNNQANPYCQTVIIPKIAKFEKKFASSLR